MQGTLKSWHIHIKGQVQGIGYRPHIYRKAKELGLKGWVSNDVNGVHIQVNGDQKSIEKFLDEIALITPPELAIINDLQIKEAEPQAFTEFQIVHKESERTSNIMITPDIAICSECRLEISNIDNRRSDYAFTTCCQCGPRYSVIHSLPYDRENTEMFLFQMCDECSSEYRNPEDRRYYSQTNSCSKCGVRMSLYDSDKKQLSVDNQSIITSIVDFWKKGKIIAIKGIGGFLLTCDAQNEVAISRLRKLKMRPSKPFAVMIPSLDHVVHLTNAEGDSLNGPVSPIVLMNAGKVKGQYHGIHDHLDRIGVMIPYAPLFQVILNVYNKPIVATSGNVSNSPITFKNNEAIDKLTEIGDYIVTNDRKITIPQDDSVIQYSERCQQKIILRRSRGLAPTYFNAHNQWQKDGILAMGAHLKSTFSILHHHNVYISQYLGDLDHYDTQQHYIHTLEHLSQLLNIDISQIVVDQHPEYPATVHGEKLAQSKDLPLLKVQHHIAHFCALLGEYALHESQEKILGVIWDGTGMGDDGHIWGSEFFTYENYEFSRCAHLDYVPIIGGDKMAREPRLSALAILYGAQMGADLLHTKFTSIEWKVYQKLLKGHAKMKTSSMGRLFDAVSTLLGLNDKQSYEGEAAMHLEVKARMFFRSNGFNPDIPNYFANNQQINLVPKNILIGIMTDINSGIPVTEIAAKFHVTLVFWIRAVALSQQCKKIGFSGGVFQNSLLVDLIILSLRDEFELLFHKNLSSNDENISFGQLVFSDIQKRTYLD